jgi:hypothetical protein
MLVDSGSSHSLISEALAVAWPQVRCCQPMQVKIADGAMIHCDLSVLDCVWKVQGTEFATILCGCFH